MTAAERRKACQEVEGSERPCVSCLKRYAEDFGKDDFELCAFSDDPFANLDCVSEQGIQYNICGVCMHKNCLAVSRANWTPIDPI